MGTFVNGINNIEECNSEAITFLDLNDVEYIIDDVDGFINELKGIIISFKEYDFIMEEGVEEFDRSYDFATVLDYVNENYPGILNEYSNLV